MELRTSRHIIGQHILWFLDCVIAWSYGHVDQIVVLEQNYITVLVYLYVPFNEMYSIFVYFVETEVFPIAFLRTIVIDVTFLTPFTTRAAFICKFSKFVLRYSDALSLTMSTYSIMESMKEN